MEKFLIHLEPSENSGKHRSFFYSCRDVDAASDYAKVLLAVGNGNYHRAVIESQSLKSETVFQQCVDPIVYNMNL